MSLVARYPFYDDLTTDSAGSYTLTQTGTSTTLTTDATMGYAASFDGTVAEGLLSGATNNTSFNGADLRTFAVWVNISSSADTALRPLWNHGTASATNYRYRLRLAKNSATASYDYYNVTGSVTYTPTFASGQWYHVVTVYTGTQSNLYVNGSYIGSTSRTLNTAQTKLSIGYDNANTNYDGFHGRMSDFRVYSGTLTGTQVGTLYSEGANPDLVNPINITYSSSNVTTEGGSDGSIDLTVTGGTGSYAYTWADGPTTADRSGLSAGTYEVTVTSGSYSAMETIVITQSFGVSGSAADASVYGASDGSVSISISGGSSPFTYLWNTGATTQNLTGLTAGSYSVRVTDSLDVTGTATFVVGQPYAIQLISMPVAVKASWPAVSGASTYKFTYQAGSSSEVVAATSRTALDLVVSDLAASTAYTLRVYSATTGAYVLAYSRPFTTPVATSNNFDKTMIATVDDGDTVYNLRLLSATSLSAVAPVVSSILNAGDSVDIEAVHGDEFRPIRATVAKLNDTLVAPYLTSSFDLPLSSYKGVYLPFTSDGGDGQETALTLTGNVNVEITYDEDTDSIALDGNTRVVGDIFVLDGKKCVVMSVT